MTNTAKRNNDRNVKQAYKSAFTIVELIVVVTIIAILSVLAISMYSSISNKAVIASLQSDLASNSKVLKSYQVLYGAFPTSLDSNNCTPDPKYCIKVSGGNVISGYSGSTSIFGLKLSNGSNAYRITDSTTPANTSLVDTFLYKDSYGSNPYYSYGYNTLITTSDGGYITVGQSGISGSSADIIVVKYSAIGAVAWSKIIGGSGDEWGNAILQTSDGGYVIAGYTSSFGVGSYDALLIKLSSTGTVSWSKTWGGAGDDRAYSVLQTSDGGYVIAGQTSSFGAGSSDGLLIKLSSTGTVSWSTTWGGTGYEYFGGVGSTSDNGYVVAGGTGTYSNPSNYGGAILLKYNSSGALIWDTVSGETSVAYDTYNLTQTSDGGSIAVGWIDDYGSATAYNILLEKYDSSGNSTWVKSYDALGGEDPSCVIESVDGGYVLTGYDNVGGLIAKFNSGGDLVWARDIAGAMGSGLRQTQDGGYTLFGMIQPSDFYIAKTDSNGQIANCNTSTTCLNVPSATVVGRIPTVTHPSATITSPSGTITSPTLSSIDVTLAHSILALP